MSGFDWDVETIRKILDGPPSPRQKYIITDDPQEFLDRIESRAKFALKNGSVDNLKYLEDLDRVKSVREGADMFETFPYLKEWNERG
jgi:hypothetical protein